MLESNWGLFVVLLRLIAIALSICSILPILAEGSSVVVSGSLRARLESWNWFETSAANPEYTFGAMLLRASVGQQLQRFDWQIEAAVPVLIGIPDDAIAPAPQGQLGLGGSYFAGSGNQDAALNLKQAYLRIKEIAGDKPSSLRLGRFEFSDGLEIIPSDPVLAVLKREKLTQRLIGPFGFTHIQRSFDGIHYIRNTAASNLTFVGARITEGVFQVEANKELDVDFWYGAYTKPFISEARNSELRAFGLHYHDGRLVLKTDNRPLALRQSDTEKIRLTTLGAHYISAMKTSFGVFDLLFWGVYQFGSWGALDHNAAAGSVEAGIQFGSKWNPWIRAGYFFSTGDGDPLDSDHNTFFQVLPTPRIHSRFPFYNLMNLRDAFIEFRLKPHSRLNLRTDLRLLRLSNSNDLWYLGGGAFQDSTFGYVGRPANDHSNLGLFLDVSADVAVGKNTGFTFYTGGIRGGDVQSSIYPEGGEHPVSTFIYVELNQRF